MRRVLCDRGSDFPLTITRPPTLRKPPPIIRGVKKLTILALFCTTPVFAQTTLYEGARLIPGDGKPAIERSAFLVDNGTITRVGKQGELRAPANAGRVDLTGKTVMPTLIDIHTHTG